MLAGTQIYHHGRLRAGDQTLQQVLDLGTTADGRTLPFSGTSYVLPADVHLVWNALEAAAGYLGTGLSCCSKAGSPIA